MQKTAHKSLTVLSDIGELFPAVVPAGFVGREVCHHRTESRAEGAEICRHGAAAGSGRFRCRLFGKGCEAHVGEECGLFAAGLEHVFYNFLLGPEGLKLVEPHALHGNADYFVFGDAERALLLTQEVLSGLHYGFLGYETHNLGACNAYTTRRSGATHLVEGYVEGCGGGIGNVHRYLRDAIFVDIPAYGLGALECAG